MQSVTFGNDLNDITRRIVTLRIVNPSPNSNIRPNLETEQEEWRELLPEYPKYYASNLGRIRGVTGKIYKCQPSSNGYITHTVRNIDGQHVKRKAHVLVALVFIANPHSKPIVNHRNGVRHDNRVINLEWATQAENVGPMRISQVRSSSKRRVIQYSIEGHPIEVWESATEAAYAVNGSKASISVACHDATSVFRGYQWKYYDDIVKPEGEEWKSLIYDGVMIHASNLGRIRGPTGAILGCTTGTGYIRVCVNKTNVYAHRIICMAWKPIEKSEMYVVNHIDNNGMNNRIDNLEWLTHADNALHYMRSFYISSNRSTNHGRRVNQLDRNGVFVAAFATAKEAFDKTGIDSAHIRSVCQGKRKTSGGFLWEYAQQ